MSFILSVKRLGLVSVFFATGFSSFSFAQEKKKTEEAKKEKLPDAVNFSASDVWSSDIYSREDHKVLVLQERKYNKAKGFEFGLHGGLTRASAFYNTTSYGAHLDYYLTEYFGLELFYNRSSSTANADQIQLNEFLVASGFSSRKEYHQLKDFADAAFIWAPIYGKFAFFRKNIIHFDLYGTGGLGYLTTTSNVTDQGGINQNLLTSVASVGTRVFLARNWSLRFDLRHAAYRQYFAPAGNVGATTNATTLWRQNFQFALGTSFIFGAKE